MKNEKTPASSWIRRADKTGSAEKIHRQQMTRTPILFSVLLTWPFFSFAQQVEDPWCPPLRSFLDSIQPGKVHEVAFHTTWGSNFKGAKTPAMFGQRCEHRDYPPAKTLCESLTPTASIEFAGNNVKRVIACLSPETHFAQRLELKSAMFSLVYGTQQRGSNVTVQFKDDPQLGGEVLRIRADGY